MHFSQARTKVHLTVTACIEALTFLKTPAHAHCPVAALLRRLPPTPNTSILTCKKMKIATTKPTTGQDIANSKKVSITILATLTYLDPCIVYMYVPAHIHTCIMHNAQCTMHILRNSHVRTCTPAHPHTQTPAHLYTCTPVHLYTCTPAHLHTCTPEHLHTCTPAHLHTCTGVRSTIWRSEDSRWTTGRSWMTSSQPAMSFRGTATCRR